MCRFLFLNSSTSLSPSFFISFTGLRFCFLSSETHWWKQEAGLYNYIFICHLHLCMLWIQGWQLQTILQGICVNSEVSATVNQQYEILNQQNKSEKKKKNLLRSGNQSLSINTFITWTFPSALLKGAILNNKSIYSQSLCIHLSITLCPFGEKEPDRKREETEERSRMRE